MAKRPRSTRDLVADALATPAPAPGALADGPPDAGAAPPATGGPPAATHTAEEGAVAAVLDRAEDEALIDLYFACESSAERDRIFERLARRESPTVRAFFRAMVAADHDDALRLDAAVVLAARGDEAAHAYLEAVLAGPASADDFAVAVAALLAQGTAGLYDRLAAMWRDPALPPAHRLAAMRALAEVDGPRACADFVPFVAESAADPAALPEDLIEAAIVTFLRYEHLPGLAALETLIARLAAHPWAPDEAAMAEERQAFVAEGIALLRP